MSYGAGHVLDMINRLRDNRSLLSYRKSSFKDRHRDLVKESGHAKLASRNLPLFSDRQVREAKRKIGLEAKKHRRKEVALFILSAFILVFIVLAFIHA